MYLPHQPSGSPDRSTSNQSDTNPQTPPSPPTRISPPVPTGGERPSGGGKTSSGASVSIVAALAVASVAIVGGLKAAFYEPKSAYASTHTADSPASTQSALQELEASAKNLNKETVHKLENPGSKSDGVAMGEVLSALDKVAVQDRTPDARAARALAVVLREQQELLTKQLSNAELVKNSGALQPNSLTSTKQLDERRKLLAATIQSTDALQKFLSSKLDKLRQAMIAEGLSLLHIQQVLNAARTPTEHDQRLIASELRVLNDSSSLLDVLHDTNGGWKIVNNEVAFAKQEDLARYRAAAIRLHQSVQASEQASREVAQFYKNAAAQPAAGSNNQP